jgi:tripartite-type tricarboxylate transporter receptor subunit TctC
MKTLMAILVHAMLAIGAGSVFAQAPYPAQTVRIIVPFPPGGAADILARGIGQKLAETLGQAFVIDNRPGAGATVGPEIVSKAAPDGYTLLLGSITNHAVAASLYSRLTYDLEKSFAPIGLLANAPHVLVAHPALPVRTAKDVIALAKARPGDINFGSLGSGTLAHLELELLQNVARVKFTHIPYKGSAPAKTDLTAGHIQLLFDSVASSGGLIQAGRLRPIAIASSARSGSLPDVPTFIESGLKDFQANNWYGLLAPAGTPKTAIDRLAAELPKILALQEIKQRYGAQGMDVTPGDGPKLAATIRADIAQWTPIVRQSGAKID